MLVQNGHGKGCYMTIINTKDDSHSHIPNPPRSDGFKMSKIVLSHAVKGSIKPYYSDFMKEAIFRLVSEESQLSLKEVVGSDIFFKNFKGGI